MATGIAVRRATAADLPALASLRREATFERCPECEDDGFEDRFAAWLEQESERRLTWLAEDGDVAVGTMNLVLFERMPRPGPDPGRWGYLATAYVRPAYRNQGAGAALVAGFGAADTLLLRDHPGRDHPGRDHPGRDHPGRGHTRRPGAVEGWLENGGRR